MPTPAAIQSHLDFLSQQLGAINASKTYTASLGTALAAGAPPHKLMMMMTADSPAVKAMREMMSEMEKPGSLMHMANWGGDDDSEGDEEEDEDEEEVLGKFMELMMSEGPEHAKIMAALNRDLAPLLTSLTSTNPSKLEDLPLVEPARGELEALYLSIKGDLAVEKAQAGRGGRGGVRESARIAGRSKGVKVGKPGGVKKGRGGKGKKVKMMPEEDEDDDAEDGMIPELSQEILEALNKGGAECDSALNHLYIQSQPLLPPSSFAPGASDDEKRKAFKNAMMFGDGKADVWRRMGGGV